MDANKIAALFGCTPEQARAQYAKNAAQQREMALHPKCANGGKYRGYTAAQYLAKAAEFEKLAAGESV